MDPRPAIPVAVDLDTKRALIDLHTGERLQEYEHIYTEYDAGRIREGYVCINCGESQEAAPHRACQRCRRLEGRTVFHDGKSFPDHCFCCGFPMRAEQTAKFAEQFDGYTTVGPSKSIAQLRLEDVEAKERARRQREGRSTSRIWLPGS